MEQEKRKAAEEERRRRRFLMIANMQIKSHRKIELTYLNTHSPTHPRIRKEFEQNGERAKTDRQDRL